MAIYENAPVIVVILKLSTIYLEDKTFSDKTAYNGVS